MGALAALSAVGGLNSANIGELSGMLGLHNPSSGPLDTLAVLGAKGKGIDVNLLREWFKQQPGFSRMQESSRVDGIFVKFLSHEAADAALTASSQFGAEWAR